MRRYLRVKPIILSLAAAFFLELAASGSLSAGERTDPLRGNIGVNYLLPDNGYSVGDTVRIEAEFTVSNQFTPDEASVTAGSRRRVNDWLELVIQGFSTEKVYTGAGENDYDLRYRIILYYQIFYVPEATTALKIPDYPVKFVKTGNPAESRVDLVGRIEGGKVTEIKAAPKDSAAFSVFVPGADIAVSSLTEKDGKVMVLSPDLAPREPNYWRVSIAALALFVSLCCITVVILWYRIAELVSEKRRSPFRTALRNMKSAKTADAALTLAYRAFNDFAGKSYFGFELDGFFEEHKDFVPLKWEIENFFKSAEEYFFADDSRLGKQDLSSTRAWLAALLRKLLKAHLKERRRGQ